MGKLQVKLAQDADNSNHTNVPSEAPPTVPLRASIIPRRARSKSKTSGFFKLLMFKFCPVPRYAEFENHRYNDYSQQCQMSRAAKTIHCWLNSPEIAGPELEIGGSLADGLWGPKLATFFKLRGSIGRGANLLIPMLILAGCGGGLGDKVPVGFVNRTQHSDVDLEAIWRAAQQALSQEVDLNPLQRIGSNVPADIKPGDPRALTVKPHQFLVSPQPDVSSSALLAATKIYRADPTGLIACPQPCNVRYAAAYSLFPHEVTRYAASWEFQGDNFTLILQYEFENQILAELGYSLRWR